MAPDSAFYFSYRGSLGPPALASATSWSGAYLLVHASRSAPWHDHARLPIPLPAQRISAGARNRATLDMTASRQPVRHVVVPRSVVFPAQLRSLCVTERPGLARRLQAITGTPEVSACLQCLHPAIHRWLPTAKAAAGVVGTITPAFRSGLQCLTGTPGPFSGLRRTIFCTGPDVELCVVSPHQAPAPPRRIAMRGSRCGTGVILAQLLRAGKY